MKKKTMRRKVSFKNGTSGFEKRSTIDKSAISHDRALANEMNIPALKLIFHAARVIGNR
ncbi:MAG: hypothetical protein R6X10_15330 [Desulfobacterales bacterium]